MDDNVRYRVDTKPVNVARGAVVVSGTEGSGFDSEWNFAHSVASAQKFKVYSGPADGKCCLLVGLGRPPRRAGVSKIIPARLLFTGFFR